MNLLSPKILTVKFLGPLLLLNSAVVTANTIPIEPVLVPLINQEKNIDIHIGKYEVTIAEFIRFANATDYLGSKKCYLYSPTSLPADSSGYWNHPDLIKEPYSPAVCMGTEGALAYASWLAKSTGKPYRLAEQSEWRYAASAGQKSRLAFGEDYSQTQICEYENVEDFATIAGLKRDHNERYTNSASCNDGAVYQTVVGMYRPNQLGLHDMMGNVRELLQSCHKVDEKDKSKCKEYDVAGVSWHWQARYINTPDWIEPNFYGSIEGFRLVLDSDKTPIESQTTSDFIKELTKAQKKAQKEHQRLKSLPLSPSGLIAELMKNNKVELNWLPVAGTDISYSVYRSYLDGKGKISRKLELVIEGLKKASFVDQLPGSGAASYHVFASSVVGESMASNEDLVGEHTVFHVGERIQAEQYKTQRNTYVRFKTNKEDKEQEKEQEHSIGFNPNERHYVPTTVPFFPAWLTFDFKSNYTGQGQLKMRLLSTEGAQFEIWQGQHLVARVTTDKKDSFVEIEATVSLISSEQPLEIRAADQNWFKIDWFEFSR